MYPIATHEMVGNKFFQFSFSEKKSFSDFFNTRDSNVQSALAIITQNKFEHHFSTPSRDVMPSHQITIFVQNVINTFSDYLKLSYIQLI